MKMTVIWGQIVKMTMHREVSTIITDYIKRVNRIAENHYVGVLECVMILCFFRYTPYSYLAISKDTTYMGRY